MSSTSASARAGQIALLTAGVAVTGILGYAVYFDYMRRNSPEFRRSLKKQHAKLAEAAQARIKEEKRKNTLALQQTLREIEAESPPRQPEEQENYFQEQVAAGEKLAAMGPESYVAAAGHFYRGLRVYPNPVELLMIYQKVVPPTVFNLLIELTTLSGASPAGGSAGASGAGAAAIAAALGGTGTPAPAPASVADIDDEVLEESPKADSAKSWEKLDGEA